MVAPVSSARRSNRLPLGPLIRACTTSRPASAKRRYSGTESNGEVFGQGGVRENSNGQTFRCYHAVVDPVTMRGMGQQSAGQRLLGSGVETVYGNEQPLMAEAFADS